MKLLLLVVLVAMSSDFLGLGTARRTYDSLESSLDYVADRQGEEFLPVKRTFEHTRRLKQNKKSRSHHRSSSNPPKSNEIDIPENFDAREKWGNICKIETPDQGKCGSCWAVAATSVMSERTCIMSRGKDKFRYSARNLASCCDDCGNTIKGGKLGASFYYWKNTGIVSGGYNRSGCQPYWLEYMEITRALNESNLTCTKRCRPDYPRKYSDDLRLAKDFYKLPTIAEDIQKEIMTRGPVAATMFLDQNFQNECHTDNVYTCEHGNKSNHAVRIIGWGQEAGGRRKKYWLIANSWGCKKSPFFKVERGFCKIESNVWAGIP